MPRAARAAGARRTRAERGKESSSLLSTGSRADRLGRRERVAVGADREVRSTRFRPIGADNGPDRMRFIAPTLFAMLCIMGLLRPIWALVLMLVMFALKVVLQANLEIFVAQSLLTNFVVAGVVFFATLVTIMRTPRPLLGHLTSSLALLLIILAWSVVSLLWSPTASTPPNEGIYIIIEGYPYLIITVLLGPILVTSMAAWREATTLMLFVGTLVAIAILTSPEITVKMGRIGFTIDALRRTSPLALGQMGGMLAIFAALSAGGRASALQALVRLAAFICGALLCLFSGSRGQAVFMLVAIAAFLPMARPLRSMGAYLATVAVGFAVAIGSYAAFTFVSGQTDIDRWTSSAIVGATALRQWSVIQLLSAFLQSPQSWLIGLGYNAFSSLEGVGDLGYVHNLFVEVLCELGVPAFVLLILFIRRSVRATVALFRMYRHHPAERSALAILAAMTCFQGLIGLKESNLWASWSFFAFALILVRLQVRETELGGAWLDDEQESLPAELDEEESLDPEGESPGLGQPVTANAPRSPTVLPG